MKQINLGVLAFHGDVIEHIQASRLATARLNVSVNIMEVRSKRDVATVHGLIIPGGESTTLHKLCVREQMWEDMKNIPAIFGTCAGAIMIAKKVRHKIEGQESLGRIDIDIDRNAYGRQTDSFEKNIETKLGNINAIFIRAPRIRFVGKSVTVLARINDEIIACEQQDGHRYAMAACFHPELTSPVFHEYFITTIRSMM